MSLFWKTEQFYKKGKLHYDNWLVIVWFDQTLNYRCQLWRTFIPVPYESLTSKQALVNNYWMKLSISRYYPDLGQCWRLQQITLTKVWIILDIMQKLNPIIVLYNYKSRKTPPWHCWWLRKACQIDYYITYRQFFMSCRWQDIKNGL